MDLTLIIIIIALGVIILFACIIYGINNVIYPRLNDDGDVLPGNSQNGQDGATGPDGIMGATAMNGDPGGDGNPGLNGIKGFPGSQGNTGFPGFTGEIGIPGAPGVIGDLGEPSNSITPVLARYDLSLTDSYTLKDFFTFEDVRYQVSMYANVQNNTRFILPTGETIPDGDGFSSTITDPGMAQLPLTNLGGGTFFSNLRIVIGYGKGTSNAVDRSDDIIFYISPPISRRSYLFRYQLPEEIDPEFGRLDIRFPINSLGNTKQFFYFPSGLANDNVLNPETSKLKYHLVKGIAKYELVVNTYPPLPDEYRFNYRIVEEFTREENKSFRLPQIEFPFNATELIYEDPGSNSSITFSNRFDLNRVIERDLTYEKLAWVQTNKRTVELVNSNDIIPVQYENTYTQLVKNHNESYTNLKNSNYYINGGEALLATDNRDLNLIVDYDNVFKYSITLGIDKYIPSIPLNQFQNAEKLFLQFLLSNNDDFNSGKNVTITYGNIYSPDLIDFRLVYSKILSFALNYSNYPPNSTSKVGLLVFTPGTVNLKLLLNITQPVIVGYTTKTGERFTLKTVCKNLITNSYYITIPLYGYKKE